MFELRDRVLGWATFALSFIAGGAIVGGAGYLGTLARDDDDLVVGLALTLGGTVILGALLARHLWKLERGLWRDPDDRSRALAGTLNDVAQLVLMFSLNAE